ncbi:MAG: SPOR domain-containing protein [Thermodesulfovibrio sp.]|jgi:cell division septation protein DedD|uniref:SPOR domain-containing protein n=1 Tax=Thermodesulfovibrio obliviosus TaxID=3118332 RepID=A0AAU8H796_9BACT
MKQKSEELLVINKKIFFLILFGIAVLGIIVGYVIGYITTPVKEIYVSKADNSEKTVLSTTVGTAFAKKQEDSTAKTEVKQEQQVQQTNEKDKLKPEIEIAQNTVQTKQVETKSQTSEQKVKKQDFEKPVKSIKYKTHKQIFYTIQVGAFSDIVNVQELQKRLKERGYESFLVKEDLYKVRIGKYKKFSQAKKLSQELHSKGFENFILKITYKGGKP